MRVDPIARIAADPSDKVVVLRAVDDVEHLRIIGAEAHQCLIQAFGTIDELLEQIGGCVRQFPLFAQIPVELAALVREDGVDLP